MTSRMNDSRGVHFLFVLTIAGIFAGLSRGQALAQEEPSSSFPDAPDTQPAPNGFTSAKDALAAFRVPAGFRATLFASEPDIRQPIAIATDPKGRLWVAENYSYAQREVNFDTKVRDRIVILEDKNRDGQYDHRTVFWDQASKLTSVEVGRGGVWALCPPNLFFIPDRDGDDKPDGPPEVKLDGWDADAVRHNIANGLRWGPDGWLYGRHGILATSQVGAPGTPTELRTKINCGVWRYHPTRNDFEVVCHGTTNSWGMDWDEHGQFFFINTVIGHLWHVLPGAHFQRMYGEDLQPNVYELIPQTADHFHWDTKEVWSDIRTKGVTPTTDQAGGGHAHSGMMIYQGGVWPEKYHNTVFTVNLHGRRLNNDRLVRRGSGYVATHEPDFAITSDPWFRGVELTAGPDGEVYVADWSDIGECHENDGVHRSSGRIFQIRYEGKNGVGERAESGVQNKIDLTKLSNLELAAAQRSKNDWTARQARNVLQARLDAGQDLSDVHRELLKQFESDQDEKHQLRAMWSLFVTSGTTEQWLVAQLSHRSEHVRSWAVQLLCDGGKPSPDARQAFVELANRESSGLVLAFLASALQRIELSERNSLATQLVRHSKFANDPVIPLMVWYGVEPTIQENPAAAVELASVSQMPKVREFISRRITSEIDRRPEQVAGLVTLLKGAKSDDQRVDILRGMSTALRGWRKAAVPAGWSELSPSLTKSDHSEIASMARELSVVFGDGRALDELRKIADSSGADLESRRAALRTLATAKAEGLPAILKKLLSERDLQVDAIRGLAAYHDPQTPQLLIERFRSLHAPGQREAINTLVSRAAYAKVLLSAVAEERIPRDLVSQFHVRQMLTLEDAEIAKQVASLWPELQQQAAEKAKQIAHFRELLTPEHLATADLSAGRATYQRVCASCHVLFGQGGKVGPDLTAHRGAT